MYKKIIILLLISFIKTSKKETDEDIENQVEKLAQQSGTQSIEFNCPVPNNDEDGRIQIGKPVRICLHLIPLGLKTIFTLQTDKKQIINLKNSYFTTGSIDSDYLIQFQNSDIFSNLIPYVRKIKNKQNFGYPFISVIFYVQNGKLQSIQVESLEEACDNYQYPEVNPIYKLRFGAYQSAFCPISCPYFDRDNTKSKYIEPEVMHSSEINCDIKIVITWKGTDRDKQPMISSMRKFTAFKQFDLKQRLFGYLKIDQYPNNTDLNQVYQDNFDSLDTEIQESIRVFKVQQSFANKVVEQVFGQQQKEI